MSQDYFSIDDQLEEIATGLDKHTGSTLNQEQLGKVIAEKRKETLEANGKVVLRQSAVTPSAKSVKRHQAALALMPNTATITSVVPSCSNHS